MHWRPRLPSRRDARVPEATDESATQASGALRASGTSREFHASRGFQASRGFHASRESQASGALRASGAEQADRSERAEGAGQSRHDGRLRVLVVTPFYLPAWKGGGPIRTLAAMIEQHGARHNFRVLTSSYDWSETEPMALTPEARRGAWVPVGAALVRYVPVTGAASLRSRATRKALADAWRSTRSGPEVTYFTGVFPPVWTIFPLTLHRLGLLRLGQVVIAPRGEFSPGALAIKWHKKQAFLAEARLIGLFKGAMWHASTELEAAEIRAIVPDAQIAIRENETQLPMTAWRGAVSLPARETPAEIATPEAGGMPDAPDDTVASAGSDAGEPSTARPLRVLYLGRISPKKGVDVLVKALRYVTAEVEVTIAGAAADKEYMDELQRLRRRLRHPVTFHGAVERDRVDGVFRSHDVFVFPTAGENFGHTIAESLANGCPVIITAHATPWTETATAGGGGAVDSLDPAAWAGAIDQFAAGGPEAWARSRGEAADAYDAWQAARPTESVFDLLGLSGPANEPDSTRPR